MIETLHFQPRLYHTPTAAKSRFCNLVLHLQMSNSTMIADDLSETDNFPKSINSCSATLAHKMLISRVADLAVHNHRAVDTSSSMDE